MLLLPGNTDVIPSEADTSTRLSKRINLNIPIISAHGHRDRFRYGHRYGRVWVWSVIHRNLPSRTRSHTWTAWRSDRHDYQPRDHRCGRHHRRVHEVCGYYRVSGLPVVSEEGVLEGIITNRDIRYMSSGTSNVAFATS